MRVYAAFLESLKHKSVPDWDTFIPIILFADRNFKNATNATTYGLIYEKEAKLPCDDSVDFDDSHALEEKLKWLEKIAQLHLTAQDQKRRTGLIHAGWRSG